MVSEVFVGRRDEQSRFAAVLEELTRTEAEHDGWWHRRRKSGETRAVPAVSRVVLVHGLGGSGKSRLLGCFRDMTEGRAPNSPVHQDRHCPHGWTGRMSSATSRPTRPPKVPAW